MVGSKQVQADLLVITVIADDAPAGVHLWVLGDRGNNQ